jgi:hypothetical protein
MTAIAEFKGVSFQDLRSVAYQHAQQVYNKAYPLAQNGLEKLGAFHNSLDTRISELQEAKVGIPSKEDLLKEREDNLLAYWSLRETAQKVKELSREFSNIVAFLTPKPRLYEESLKDEAPDLLSRLKECEEMSLKWVKDVSDWYGKIDTLQIRMFEKLDLQVSYSLQMFCQIVGNDGKPLSGFTRAMDYCTTPVIPKPQPKEAEKKIEKIHDGEVEDFLTKSTMF